VGLTQMACHQSSTQSARLAALCPRTEYVPGNKRALITVPLTNTY